MLTLLSLPNELVLEIATYLLFHRHASYTCQLPALLRCNRRLHHLLHPLLYRDFLLCADSGYLDAVVFAIFTPAWDHYADRLRVLDNLLSYGLSPARFQHLLPVAIAGDGPQNRARADIAEQNARWLISHGADVWHDEVSPNSVKLHWYCPLTAAAVCNFPDVVEMLLVEMKASKGVESKEFRAFVGASLLLAASDRAKESLKVLLGELEGLQELTEPYEYQRNVSEDFDLAEVAGALVFAKHRLLAVSLETVVRAKDLEGIELLLDAGASLSPLQWKTIVKWMLRAENGLEWCLLVLGLPRRERFVEESPWRREWEMFLEEWLDSDLSYVKLLAATGTSDIDEAGRLLKLLRWVIELMKCPGEEE